MTTSYFLLEAGASGRHRGTSRSVFPHSVGSPFQSRRDAQRGLMPPDTSICGVSVLLEPCIAQLSGKHGSTFYQLEPDTRDRN